MSKEIATQETASIVDVVSKKVRDLESAKQINFPVDFSPENALKTFWLILQFDLLKLSWKASHSSPI
jgi:hypothetical protein